MSFQTLPYLYQEFQNGINHLALDAYTSHERFTMQPIGVWNRSEPLECYGSVRRRVITS